MEGYLVGFSSRKPPIPPRGTNLSPQLLHKARASMVGNSIAFCAAKRWFSSKHGKATTAGKEVEDDSALHKRLRIIDPHARRAIIANAKLLDQDIIICFLFAILEWEQIPAWERRERRARACKLVSLYVDTADMADNLFMSLQTREFLLRRRNIGPDFFATAKREIIAHILSTPELARLFL